MKDCTLTRVFGAHTITVSTVQRTPAGHTVEGAPVTVKGVFFARRQNLVLTPQGEKTTATAQVSIPAEHLHLVKADGAHRVTYDGETFTVIGVEYTRPPSKVFPNVATVYLQ